MEKIKPDEGFYCIFSWYSGTFGAEYKGSKAKLIQYSSCGKKKNPASIITNGEKSQIFYFLLFYKFCSANQESGSEKQ